jgi:hypothetical protein
MEISAKRTWTFTMDDTECIVLFGILDTVAGTEEDDEQFSDDQQALAYNVIHHINDVQRKSI